MGFLELFAVASFPLIKVLLITALGLFLAMDDIDIMGQDARQRVNHIVFYVFNPSLVVSNFARTITLESFALLWFMPINVLATFILGSALGWVLIKITRPPKHLEGLILGCCSAGNLANMPLIILPALCKEKGTPFGDAGICYQYAMTYASLSMAIAAVFLWGYVYNIMRIYSSRVQREDCDTLDDDAYTIPLPITESDEEIPILDKIRRRLRMISTHVNFQSMFAPSTIAAIIGFIIGVIPQIRNSMIGSDAPLRVVEESAYVLGEASIPTVTLLLGANLLRGLKGTSAPLWTTVGIVVVRFILLPLLGVVVVKGAIHFGLVQSNNPLYHFTLLLQHTLPPAMNIGLMAQLLRTGESEFSVIMLWTYALASVTVTLWSTYFMWLVS